MADSQYLVPGASIGTGIVRGFRNKLDQRMTGPARSRFHNELVINTREPMPLSDMPSGFLRLKTSPVALGKEAKRRKDVSFDRPLSISQSKCQAPDLETHSLDFMTIPAAGTTNIPAGARQQELLRFQTTIAVRGILKKVGWYTSAAGAANLQFGLYVGDQLVVPGCRLIADRPRTIEEYNPSGSSIAFRELADMSESVPPNTVVRILVSNTDLITAYPAWGRVWGWAWEEQAREDGRRAYYNEQFDKIA